MGSPNTRGKRGGAAASLLSGETKPKVIEGELVREGTPIDQATLEEHKAAQREYRDFMARMATESPAEAAQADAEAAEVVALPTPEELAQRAHEESLGAYLHALIEMPADEPRYVVGLRPPRPQFAGLVLEIGDVVPGAAHWPRLESWVRSGIVVPEALARRAG